MDSAIFNNTLNLHDNVFIREFQTAKAPAEERMFVLNADYRSDLMEPFKKSTIGSDVKTKEMIAEIRPAPKKKNIVNKEKEKKEDDEAKHLELLTEYQDRVLVLENRLGEALIEVNSPKKENGPQKNDNSQINTEYGGKMDAGIQILKKIQEDR